MTKPQPNLPQPFLDAQVQSRSSLPGRLAMRPALVVFLLCLLLGLVAVGWRAKRRAEDARSRARAEALVRATAVESQFGQASSAAEVLGALARQFGGAIPNFPKIAAELLAARPGVGSLELQPGGVVSDIVPRAGNERVIGFNVLSHPAYGPGAKAAIQKGGLTVAGPLALYRGEPGIVARVPVFLRGRDGRDAFWGFVAVSMRLSDALGRARVDELARQGYSYAFLAPSVGTQKPATIAARGAVSLQDAVQQPVRAHDLEFRLAVHPRGGWANKTRLLLEALGVLAGSGLLCLLVNLLEGRRAMEASLAEANERLARETTDRKQSQAEGRTARDETAAVRAELDQARAALQSSTEQEVRLNVAVRAAQEAAQARQGELDQARMALQQGEQTIRSLQARLRDAGKAEKESGAALQSQLEAAQATITELQTRLDTEIRRAREAEEVDAAETEPAASAPEETAPPPEEREVVVASPAPEPAMVAPPVPASKSDAPAPALPEATPGMKAPSPAEAPADRKPTRPARRKKPRRDNQMDLFETQTAAAAVLVAPAADTAATDPAVETAGSHKEEASAPSTKPVEEEPEQTEQGHADAADESPAEPKLTSKPKEEPRARSLPPPPPVNPAQLRKAVNQILPLFTGQDPGARDCLKDNRSTFRSAFSPEGYVEFEQSVKKGDFNAALEHLKRAAKRHGIPV